MVEIQITDAGGRGAGAFVEDNALLVTQYPCPPMLTQKNKIFRQYLTQDGTASGTFAMNVDGSSTSVPYYVEADNDNDIYIARINFIVAYGSAANLAEWCDDGSALTNGFRFYYEREDAEINIHDAVKTNGDLVRLGVDTLVSDWEVQSLAANNDYGLLVTVSFTDIMPPYGIKLDAGAAQRLVFEVRDDNQTAATGCDLMNCIAYGMERFA